MNKIFVLFPVLRKSKILETFWHMITFKNKKTAYATSCFNEKYNNISRLNTRSGRKKTNENRHDF